MKVLDFDKEYKEIDKLKISDSSKAQIRIKHLLTLPLTEIQRIKLNANLAYCYWGIANQKAAIDLYSEVLNDAIRLNLMEEQADALSGLGVMDSDEGRFSEAELKIKEALEIYQLVNLLQKEAQATNRLALNYFAQGKMQESQTLLERTATLSKDSNDLMYIQARNNIALIYLNEGKFKLACEEFKYCMDTAKRIEFEYGRSIMLGNYAETLQLMGEFKEADIIYQEGIKYAKQIEDFQSYAILNSNYASLLVLQGKLNSAESKFRESLEIYQDYDDKPGYVEILESFAKFWIVKGNFKEALITLHEAHKIISETGLINEKISVLTALAEIYQAMHKYDTAYQYLQEATEIAYQIESDEARITSSIGRGVVNINKMNLYEAELILLDTLRLIEASNFIVYRMKVELLLAKISFIHYLNNQSNKEFLTNTINFVSLAVSHSRENKLFLDFVNASMLLALLLSLERDYKKAKALLNSAQKMAEDKQMLVQKSRIKQHLLIASPKKREMKNLSQVSEMLYNLIEEDFQRITMNYFTYTISEKEIQSIFILSYKMDEKIGSELLSFDNLEVDEMGNIQSDMLSTVNLVGSLYTMSLGQGQNYNEGLFGPFPFGASNLRSLVFSKKIFDKSQKQRRNKGLTFTIVCLIFPNQISRLFIDQKKMEQIFEMKLQQISDVAEITPIFLRQVRELIIQEFIIKNVNEDHLN
ncbi:MAG: tetratricopeptide repeat protein [Promethearchaeota archaeon]